MKVRRIEVKREFNVVCEFMSPGRELPEPLTPSIQKYLINCRDEDGVAGKIFLPRFVKPFRYTTLYLMVYPSACII